MWALFFLSFETYAHRPVFLAKQHLLPYSEVTMSLLIVLLIAMAAGLTGIALGWFLRFIISLGK